MSVRSLTPASEDALPQITALTQPYMFTIGAGAGQRVKPESKARKFEAQALAVLQRTSRRRGLLRQTERGDGGADQLLDAPLTPRIVDRQCGGSSIADQGLLFAAKLGIEIAAGQLKKRVRRIFFHQGADDIQGALVLLIVAMQIHGQIKARHIGSENAIGDSVFEQANSLLLRTAGNAHKETHDFCQGAESIHVIVVQAEAKIGVGQAGVESLGAKKMFARAHAEASCIAIFAA